ncbi:MAG: diguanylate cyclase [Candidatus Scalindua sp.]|nr:diguanylate cyclase [Candidatus Scalindua sp.]
MRFILLLILFVTLLGNCGSIIYRSSPTRNSMQTTEDFFTYKTPDDSIWINKDKEALGRLRKHYIKESDQIITSLEAEKNLIIPFSNLAHTTQKSLASTYNLYVPKKESFQNRALGSLKVIIINSLITTIGFLLLYVFCTKTLDKNAGNPSAQGIRSAVLSQKVTSNHETPGNLQVLSKAKDIICEILQAINTYSDSCLTPKRKELEDFIRDRIPMIRSSFNREEFLALESDINKTIPSHFARARELIQIKFDELKSLITSFADDLGAITRDNSNFSDQIKSSMSHIENAIELDEIKEIRKKITAEVDKVGEIVLEKQKRDKKTIETLTHRVKALDKELVSAKEKNLIDGLTQLFNRRAFDRKLEDAIEQNAKTRKSFALIMADIDYFKKINDEYGHIVGDKVLKRVSAVIKKTFRLNDFAARYGGEEFVILIDRIDKQSVNKLCERFRSDIEFLDFKDKNETIPTSISIGVAFCNRSDTPEVLLRRADKALYLAKQSGRNIVKTEDDITPTFSVTAAVGV